MGIRIPKKRASMMTAEDTSRIKSILEMQKSSIRTGEVATVILLSDDTFVEIDPEELHDLAFSGNAGEKEEEKEEVDSSYDLANILTDFARSETRTASKSPKSGRRAEVLAEGKRGRYVRARMPRGETSRPEDAFPVRSGMP